MTYENHLHHLGPFAHSEHYAGVAAVIERLAVPADLPENPPCPTQDELG